MYLSVIINVINFTNMSQRIITSQYFDKMKYIYSSLGLYTKSVILFGGFSYMANNWTLYMYRDYYYCYYRHTSAPNVYGNILSHQAVLLGKAIHTGVIWPFIALDFMFFNNKENNYYPFRYITPYCGSYMTMGMPMKIVNENDKSKQIDVTKSIEKYGVWGFYCNKKYISD